MYVGWGLLFYMAETFLTRCPLGRHLKEVRDQVLYSCAGREFQGRRRKGPESGVAGVPGASGGMGTGMVRERRHLAVV